MAARISRWYGALREATGLALDSIRAQPLRSTLAMLGIVIGILTVVVVASVLANVRNQVALLFRELGTDNVFAFHLTGDPYQPASEEEARRKPLESSFAEALTRSAPSIKAVAGQLIVPPIVNGRALVARAGDNESDTVLVEGVSPNFFEIVGAEFASGRPFTDLENRVGTGVAVIGAGLARALFGDRDPVGRTLTLAGERLVVVGTLAPRQGGFFGENRQDRILSLPIATAQRRFAEAENTVLYIRSAGDLARTRRDAESILRRLRRLGPDEPNDFTLSTSESIIRTLDEVSARIGLVTVALAAVSLVIGGIGIANVMIIGVTERTREIGLRLAVGARRREVLGQFLIEASLLSGAGGAAGVAVALAVGWAAALVLDGFSAVVPVWAVAAGLGASLSVGLAAGYWPARRAASLDPVEALRHE